jgi:hypothetical protein
MKNSTRILSICIPAAALLLHGCSGLFSGFGAASSERMSDGTWGNYPVPITDGFRNSLPRAPARVVIWGGHPAATGSAINWLQRQGLRVVERAQLRKIFDEQHIQITHTPDDEAQVLRVGKLLGADAVVFLDTPITGGTRSSGGGFAYGNVGSSNMDSASVYSTSAWIRGVSVETGEVLWSATARYPQSSASLDNVLAVLTCHALATAWGYRESGQPEHLLDMCMVKGPPPF